MKKIHNRIRNVINSAMSVIEEDMLKDGSFLSFSSFNYNFTESIKYKTTFSTSNILLAINELDVAKQETFERSIGYILSQRSNEWSWNYWDRNSPQSKDMPYPDDMDDTALALSVLKIFRDSELSGIALANVVETLTRLEDKEGGPYRTWLVARNSSSIWQDVDLAVNSNIAYFLSLNNISLPSITQIQDVAIRNSAYDSKYYPCEYPVIYYISRTYNGAHRDLLINYLIGKKLPKYLWGNTLNNALVITSLLNMGFPHNELSEEISSLVSNVEKYGFNPHPFCIDPSINKEMHVSGSRAITAAFVAGALGKYEKAKISNEVFDEWRIMSERIMGFAIERFNNCEDSIRVKFNDLLHRVAGYNKNCKGEIILLPYYFFLSLRKNLKSLVDIADVENLCLANLYGWMAYKIYDDIIDNDADPEMLGVANICLRELTLIYHDFLREDIDLFKEYMDKLDASGLWDRTNAMNGVVPEYGNMDLLADKSIGHILGPLAIMVKIGYRAGSAEFEQVNSALRDYLVARQLNDDAHDWRDDLEKIGYINSVASMIMKESPEESMGEIFWSTTIKKVASLIIERVNQSKMIFRDSAIFHDLSNIYALIDRIRISGERVLKDHDKAEDFLRAYK